MLMSCAVEDAARKVEGKKSIAVEAFARALRQVRYAARTERHCSLVLTMPLIDPDHTC